MLQEYIFIVVLWAMTPSGFVGGYWPFCEVYNSCGSLQGPVAGVCEYGNEPSVRMWGSDHLEYPSACCPVKGVCGPWRWSV
jgi:hypothetical protein